VFGHPRSGFEVGERASWRDSPADFHRSPRPHFFTCKHSRFFAVRLLDRYVLSTFLRAYVYCIAAFISIWLVFDISDNISTFLDERISLGQVGQYYLTQVPQILVILLPVSLLLALLFSLGRMSRTNEIVSMLTACWCR
jgi:hypothetical protein